MLQCQVSVDRFTNIGRPIYRILSGILTATYRSTDLPKSVDRFVLWTNQFKTKPKPKQRVQTIIKIILTKPGLPQQPLGLFSRARTCGTRFRRTDPEESSREPKIPKYGFYRTQWSKTSMQASKSMKPHPMHHMHSNSHAYAESMAKSNASTNILKTIRYTTLKSIAKPSMHT